jgi:hypothetical protein
MKLTERHRTQRVGWLRAAVLGAKRWMACGMENIRHEVIVETDEPDYRLELLRDHGEKVGMGFNTIAPGTTLSGALRRKEAQT